MKLSEYKNEEALDILADILEPSIEIFTDKALIKLIQGKDKPKAISYAIKNHKKPILSILAILDGKKPEEYECNVFTLPAKILEILNDEELMSFFSSQLPTEGQIASGNVMENTEEAGK